MMKKPTIYELTREQLTSWLAEREYSEYWAAQVWDQLYKKRRQRFIDMDSLQDDLIEVLDGHFVMQTISEHVMQQSKDGTVKFLFKLRDGHLIETVLMTHKYGLSVCVTTQVGCNIGCSFCASGLLAKSRDLTAGEIVEQLIHVQHFLDQRGQQERVSHIVVMGIGEPFDNFANLTSFLTIITDQRGLAIGARRITVSTSGLADKIIEFADAQLQVNLAISLHAPNDELRTRIMKINRAYPIAKLMQAVDYYLAKTKRKIAFEYIMLRDINDQPDAAIELAELLADRRQLAYVNLIPYNPVDEHSQYQRSSKESILAFYDILKKKGIHCGIRHEHGTDIDAACGQLRSKQLKSAAQ